MHRRRRRRGKPGSFKGKVIGGWRIKEFLGAGGNGIVFRATDGARHAAIKIAKASRGARVERFLSEIEAMRRCSDIPGVLPILDSGVLENRGGKRPWFAMGLAKPIQTALGAEAKMAEVIAACHQIAETMAQVHGRGISHRDIKPENLFWYSDRFAVGDFGLVDFPGKPDLTEKDKKLGPLYYIAPEMLSGAADADGAAADVYSFAKTVWVLVTDQKYPIQGQLDRTNVAIALSSHVSEPRAGLLDRLLEAATAYQPRERPSMADVADELGAWARPRETIPESPLDLVDLAPVITGINSRLEADERRRSSNQQRMDNDGLRIREAFRPLAERMKRSMEEAGFLNVRLSIDNYHWGFELAGHVLAARGPGESELHLKCLIGIPGEIAQVKIDIVYQANLNFGKGAQKLELSSRSVSFWPGGATETVAVDTLLAQLSDAFRPSVQRVLELAQNPER